MNLRIARKILVRGRPPLPAGNGWGPRPCAQARAARKVVIRHWYRQAWPCGVFNDERDAWCHADNRAMTAQSRRFGVKP